MGIIGIPAIVKDMVQTHREFEEALSKAVTENSKLDQVTSKTQ